MHKCVAFPPNRCCIERKSGVAFVGRRHPQKALNKVRKSPKMTVSSPQEVLLRLAFAPSSWRTSLFRLEDAVELRARGEPTLGRDHVVAVMRVLQHHALCSAKTNIAQPHPKRGVQALGEIDGQIGLGDAEGAGQGHEVDRIVFVATLDAPAVDALLDQGNALLGER